jgi:hypothetical protein
MSRKHLLWSLLAALLVSLASAVIRHAGAAASPCAG